VSGAERGVFNLQSAGKRLTLLRAIAAVYQNAIIGGNREVALRFA